MPVPAVPVLRLANKVRSTPGVAPVRQAPTLAWERLECYDRAELARYESLIELRLPAPAKASTCALTCTSQESFLRKTCVIRLNKSNRRGVAIRIETETTVLKESNLMPPISNAAACLLTLCHYSLLRFELPVKQQAEQMRIR